jgi:hypothetical protein
MAEDAADGKSFSSLYGLQHFTKVHFFYHDAFFHENALYRAVR